VDADAGMCVAPPEHVLVADLGQHVVGAGYQRTLAPWAAAQLVASFYDPWTQNSNFLGVSGDANRGDLIGAIARGRVFFYPLRSAPQGIWISPFTQAGVGWATRDGQTRSGPIWAAGLSVGYSILLGRSVLVGAGGGLQFHAAHIPGGGGAPSFARLYPHLDIQLGYAF
jgi:hypothetical protein